MTDVIFSFILQKSFDDLFEELKTIIDKDVSEKIKKELVKQNESIESEYSKLNNKITRIFSKEKGLDRSNPESIKLAYNIITNLTQIQNQFREVMNQNTCFVENTEDEQDKKKIPVSTFAHCLQEFGNRIRSHGNISSNKEFSGEHMFAIAQRANDFIKAVQTHNKENGLPSFICLDAIRNPYEATYFQDRYSSFYLVSVSTDDDERVRRLSEKLSGEQIKALDNKEYPKKLRDEAKFTNQNIGACVQLADIYLYNPHETTKEKYFVTESAINLNYSCTSGTASANGCA